jgi:hypothetical protein
MVTSTQVSEVKASPAENSQKNKMLTTVLAILLVFSLVLNGYLLYMTFMVDKAITDVQEDDDEGDANDDSDDGKGNDEDRTKTKTVTGYIYSLLEEDGTPQGEKLTTMFSEDVTTSGGEEFEEREQDFSPFIVENSKMKMTFTSDIEGEYEQGFSEYEQVVGVKNFTKIYRVKPRGENLYYYTNSEITTKSPGCPGLIEGYITPPCGQTQLGDKTSDVPGSGFIISIKCESKTEGGLTICDLAVVNLKIEEI